MDDSYDDQQHTSQEYPLGKIRVLLVDDHVLTQNVVKAMLEHINCDVCVATNGKEAINLVQERLFDIVFMDCIMSDMDGFETTRTIRKLEAQPLGLFQRYLTSLDEGPRQYPSSTTPRNLATSEEHPIPGSPMRISDESSGLAGTKSTRVCRVPIIAFTAGIFDIEECLAAGMDDLLCKPVNLVQFKEKLRQWALFNS